MQINKSKKENQSFSLGVQVYQNFEAIQYMFQFNKVKYV